MTLSPTESSKLLPELGWQIGFLSVYSKFQGTTVVCARLDQLRSCFGRCLGPLPRDTLGLDRMVGRYTEDNFLGLTSHVALQLLDKRRLIVQEKSKTIYLWLHQS